MRGEENAGTRGNTSDHERLVATSDSISHLANETRLGILQTLADAETPLSYTEIFDRIDVDDSGHLNYHLRQLRGKYVRQTDAGYALRQPGLRAANLLASNALQRGTDRPFEAIDSTCGNCGSNTVEIGYTDGEGIVRCPACDVQFACFDFPPSAARAHSLDKFATAFARRTRRFVGLADDGVCPFCMHTMTTTLERAQTDRPETIHIRAHCEACPAGIRSALGLVLLNRPAVVAAFHDASPDRSITPFWEHNWCMKSTPELVQTDPLRAELETTLDENTIRATVNADVELEEFHY